MEFLSANKKNIIKINNSKQKTLLLGNILNDENIFKLEYIFDYNNDYDLDNEIKIIKNNYNEYIHNNIIFFEKYNVSPIFNENDRIIGYGYKYINNNNNFNNSPIDHYIKDDFINMIHLFNYYHYINNKINNINLSIELSSNEYYLVSEEWIKEIRNIYNYERINKELISKAEVQKLLFEDKNNNDFKIKNKKSTYSFIKYLSFDFIKEINYNYEKVNNINEFIHSIPNVIIILKY